MFLAWEDMREEKPTFNPSEDVPDSITVIRLFKDKPKVCLPIAYIGPQVVDRNGDPGRIRICDLRLRRPE